jgi:hypothetical protein
MSYVIETISVIEFVENNFRLPRFQRKATWKEKQNFELAISVFQDYPVGVVIVNQERRGSSWLLDGRQRRSALSAMRNNPVELYRWAMSYIGFGKKADETEVTEKYWEKIDRYLQTEETTDDKYDKDKDDDINVYEESDSIQEEEENSLDSFDSVKQREGLQTLLDIILMVHQISPKKGSKWEQTFDFRDYFPFLKYAPIKNNSQIDPKELRRFLLEFLNSMDQENSSELTQESFVDYYLQNFPVNDQNNQNQFKKDVKNRWGNISKSLDVISRSEEIFKSARIGIIRLTNATPLDAQNIFSRTNRGGTQLQDCELLSAKPYWNQPVNSCENQDVEKRIKEMYTILGVSIPEPFVRWDIAATFVSRIKDQNLIFDTYEDERKKREISMDEINLGFKLLGSIYEGGMSRKHVNALEKNRQIMWGNDIDQLANELNTVCTIMLADTFFKYYQSWKRPITKLMGNAIALEFLTIMWLDWKFKGCPENSVSSKTDTLKQDARILFDRLIFEYATRTWRGSGDSKMANDIKNWKDRVKPVAPDDWKNFIVGACKGNYNGQNTTVKTLRPVLYYYYALTECCPTNQVNVSFDVDHIIPQESFEDNKMVDPIYRDSLINLALLPTKENITKKAKALDEITDPWLKEQITAYTGIAEKDFQTYSNIANIKVLHKQRSKLFQSAFDTKRQKVLSNK